jgi:DNA-directed RNA polymerases I, II, and III subunit RPABC1
MWDRTIQTLFSLLKVRGHALPAELPEMAGLAGDKKKDVCFTVEQPRTLVFLTNEKKVGIRTIRVLLGHMEAGAHTAALCVFVAQPTPFAKRELLALQQETPAKCVELFYTSELRIDITQHQMVPRHTRLSRAERDAVLQKYAATTRHMPKILLTDPMARYLGLRQGDMVRIDRKMGNQGELPMYRVAASQS